MSALVPSPIFIHDASGSTDQNNVQQYLAPNSSNNVIWFVWLCPATGSYFIKTRDGPSDGSTGTNFFSAIAVYESSVSNPTDTSQLTQFQPAGFQNPPGQNLPVLMYDQSQGVGNGFETGAYAAFAGTAGTTYVFGVSARLPLTLLSGSGGNANLFLKWGTHYPPILAGCTGGIPVNFGNWQCMGNAQWADITAGLVAYDHNLQTVSLSFGSFPQRPGVWMVQCQSGCFLVFTNAGSPGCSGAALWAFFTAIGEVTTNGTSVGVDPGGGGVNLYVDEASCNANELCHVVGPFNNIAGVIEASFTVGAIGQEGNRVTTVNNCNPGPLYSNCFGNASMIDVVGPGGPFQIGNITYNSTVVTGSNDNGDPLTGLPQIQNSHNNPTLHLLYQDPNGQISLASDEFDVSPASGGEWEALPTFQNGFNYAWDNVTILLEINNVSTGASQTVSFATGGTQSPGFIFAANPTTGLLTASFVLSRNGVRFETIANIPLYPVGAPNFFFEGNGTVNGNTILFTDYFHNVCSDDAGLINLTFNASNGINNWFNGQVQFLVSVAGSGSLYDGNGEFGPACTAISSPRTYQFGDNVYILKPAVNSGTTLTITPQFVVNGTVVANFPAQTYSVTFS